MTITNSQREARQPEFIRERSTQELRAFINRKLNREELQNEVLFD